MRRRPQSSSRLSRSDMDAAGIHLFHVLMLLGKQSPAVKSIPDRGSGGFDRIDFGRDCDPEAVMETLVQDGADLRPALAKRIREAAGVIMHSDEAGMHSVDVFDTRSALNAAWSRYQTGHRRHHRRD